MIPNKHLASCLTLATASRPRRQRSKINLSRLPQLFNSLDPSPFLERDLDRDAEDYIVGSAEKAPRQHALALVIHLPADQLPAQGLPNLRDAIHNYFAFIAAIASWLRPLSGAPGSRAGTSASESAKAPPPTVEPAMPVEAAAKNIRRETPRLSEISAVASVLNVIRSAP
jgi:hypothetical protein